MKEFEFDDIEISDEKQEFNEEKTENLKEDPLYQKFNFDIDTGIEDIEIKEEPKIDEVKEEPNVEKEEVNEVELDQPSINNFFEEKEETPEEKPLFSNTNTEIDNPFVTKKVEEEVKISEEEEVENMYKEANKDIKPVISYNEEELNEIENKEDALEEALSHTTKFSPFKESKPEVNDLEIEESKEEKEKNGIAYLIILFVILLVAIFVIPKIASLL